MSIVQSYMSQYFAKKKKTTHPIPVQDLGDPREVIPTAKNVAVVAVLVR